MMSNDSLFDLTGKVAVVTGGGDGIGKASCEILAASGAAVVVSDISFEKAQGVADGIVAAGGKSAAVVCNVLNSDDLTHLIDFAVDTFGTVNILVNNAGIGGGGRESPFKIDREYVSAYMPSMSLLPGNCANLPLLTWRSRATAVSLT